MAERPFLYIFHKISYRSGNHAEGRRIIDAPRDAKSTEGRAEGLRFLFPVAKMTMDAP